MRKIMLVCVALLVLTAFTPVSARGLSTCYVTPNPVAQYSPYTISGHFNKSTEFVQVTITAPSNAKYLIGGWLNTSGDLMLGGTGIDGVPLVVSDFSSELGVYKVDLALVFGGPKGTFATCSFAVQ